MLEVESMSIWGNGGALVLNLFLSGLSLDLFIADLLGATDIVDV